MADPFNPAPGSDIVSVHPHRLKIARLDAYIGSGIGAEGMPMLRLSSGSGSSACAAYGIPFDELVAACDAFNARLVAGKAPEQDPVTARRLKAASAAALGDRVRDLVLEMGL